MTRSINDVIVTTTVRVPGQDVAQVPGLVRGSINRTKHAVRMKTSMVQQAASAGVLRDTTVHLK